MSEDIEHIYQQLIEACKTLVEKHEDGISRAGNWYYIGQVVRYAQDYDHAREHELDNDNDLVEDENS